MTATDKNPKVDAYLEREKTWRQEFEALRSILRDFDLTEDFKWGHPCYALGKSNIVLMHGFKEYCALLFFKGALMKDPSGILVQQTENVQAARQIRFTSADEIKRMANALKSYVQEAIDVERAGLKVEFKKEFDIPEEFQSKLDERPELKTAFEALTPGRQRAYLLHFSGAKQSKTREARIEKCIPQILEGKGLDD
jgi:uncharacterized protein YdeI (YjbR/CyaY-like superfamily)